MSKFPNGYTKTMVDAAEELFVAMALEETIRPVVVAYEQEILDRLQLRTDPRYAVHGIDRVVLDRRQTYLLSAEDQATFLNETYLACQKAKLRVAAPENCPLLEAEFVRMKKENAFLEALAEHPDLGLFKDYRELSLEERSRAIELSLRLLAPFVSAVPDILDGVIRNASGSGTHE
ncbi:hypothetical protein LJR129_005033 [Acidovorax sp. LjRoot129]|uniref:hypothetical protein n=1 Tax=unclassified Acidovorax TaxID=2684926 RepID=UPI003ECE973D